MPLSNLEGPWRWEKRNGNWWRIHTVLDIEDGPHHWDELNLGMGGFAESGSRWYDRDGEPIPMIVANDLLQNPDYVVVAQDVFVIDDEPVKVSTVWLGLDHNWMPNGPRMTFETMIFGGKHHMWQRRYTWLEQAREGHLEAISLVQPVQQEGKNNGEDPGS